MTFHYTDPDGDHLHITPTSRYGQPAINLRTARADGQGAAGVDVPVDQLEDVVAGLRDTARQAAAAEDGELYTAAATMRMLSGPAAEPIARLLEALAKSAHDQGAPFHDEALAAARAINGQGSPRDLSPGVGGKRGSCTQQEATLGQAEKRLRAADFTARHWHQAAIDRSDIPQAHAIACIRAALAGETRPGQLGLDEAAHDAFLTALAQPSDPAATEATEPTPCDSYQPPTTPTETGLCARCGMYDYKHHPKPASSPLHDHAGR